MSSLVLDCLDEERIASPLIYYVIQSSLALLPRTEGEVGVHDSEDKAVVHHDDDDRVLGQAARRRHEIWITHPASHGLANDD